MTKQVFMFFCCAGITAFFSCKDSSSKFNWEKTQIGSMGLTIEAPFKFREKNIEAQLTPAVRKVIKKMETFFNEEKGNYYAISVAEYAEDVNFSIEGAVNGALTEMRLKAGGQISNRKDETKQINGHEASLTSATISDKNDNKLELQMAIINKDNRMYQVMGLYKQKNDEAKNTAERLVHSIQIN